MPIRTSRALLEERPAIEFSEAPSDHLLLEDADDAFLASPEFRPRTAETYAVGLRWLVKQVAAESIR